MQAQHFWGPLHGTRAEEGVTVKKILSSYSWCMKFKLSEKTRLADDLRPQRNRSKNVWQVTISSSIAVERECLRCTENVTLEIYKNDEWCKLVTQVSWFSVRWVQPTSLSRSTDSLHSIRAEEGLTAGKTLSS